MAPLPIPMKEAIHKRHWNGNEYLREDGKGVARVHQKWKNYLSEDGEWKEIDCIIKQRKKSFEVEDAPFLFRAPLYADEEVYFEANCRYDIYKKEEIKEDPLGRYMQCKLAKHVRGELYDLNENGRMDSVIYRDAFKDFSGDLIYFVDHAKAPVLRQLVRFNSDVKTDTDMRIPFRVRFTHTVDVYYDHSGPNPWDRGILSTKKAIWHKPRGTDSMRGIGFSPFYIWDSANKKECISVEYEKRLDGYAFTKVLPKEFFKNAVYPVYTDDTAKFYPNADPESTTMDASIESSNSSFASARDAATGTSINTSSATGLFAQKNRFATSGWVIARAMMTFDASAFSQATITSAKISLYGSAKTNGNGTTSIHCVAATPASNSNIVVADFDQVGTVSFAEIAYASFSTSDYNDFSLNASGLANVVVQGISRFAFREDQEFDNSSGMTIGTSNDFSGYFADETGTSKDPYLEYTYVSPPAAPSDLTVTSADTSDTLTLNWVDNASDEDNILVERSTSSMSGFSQITSEAADTEMYADDLNAFDALRYYRVRAFKTGDAYSSYSNTASATTAPAIPTSVSATPGSGQIVLTWSDTSTTLTEIRIERKVNSGSFVEIDTVEDGVETYTDTSVMDSNTYTYRVRAYRSTDTRFSGYSSTSAAQPTPGVPYNVSASAISATDNILLKWVDNSNSETNYRVERSATGVGSWSEIAQPAANSTTYTDDISAFDTQRFYRIRSYRDADTLYSDYSVIVSAYSAPAAPSSIVLVRGSTALSITWSNTSTTKTEYRIERSVNGSTFRQIGVATSASFVDRDINSVDTYTYKVRCYRASDQVYSAYSATEESAGTGVVADIALFGGCIDGSTGASKIQLTWSSKNVNDESYLIERSPNGNDTWTTVASISSSSTTYTDTGLTDGTTYYYRVSNIIAEEVETTSDVLALKATPGKAGDLTLSFLHKVRNFP